MTLEDIHARYLTDHAIRPEIIEATGIYSADGEIIFPWTDGDKRTEQRRPWPGEAGQYFWEKDKELHFWDLRDAGPASPILLIEGTKQSLATVSYAPDTYSVLGMAGCEGWNRCDLSRFQDRTVYVGLDADAGTNLSVYEAGDLFMREMEFYDAKVKFIWLPARGKSGMDDVLANKPADIRSRFIEFLVTNSKEKPAERKPLTRKGARMETILPDTGDRVGVAVNVDRKEVIDRIVGAMRDKLDGISLFNYGENLTRVIGHQTKPMESGGFHALLADTIACFRYTEATEKKPAIFDPAWPDPQTVSAVMSKADEFSPLRRVVRVPFLRPDGSVVTAAGYDRETATVLVPGGLNVDVPEKPTQAEATEAAKFLMEEWLGDFPMATPADRANTLALILTPFIRGLVPLAPLAVVNGLEAGVGKNLIADCISILATGEAAMPLPWVANDEEMRKQITSSFASGRELFVFDEAHVIEGTQMARALTSLTYGDRILGQSKIMEFPNLATWVSLGNQVHVNGDMSRRVYFIALRPVGTTLEDRDSRSYRHPDIKLWTAENRDVLVRAALTVLRGWYAAGKPSWDRGAAMGSFEPWDRMMSSVLGFVGYTAFLSDMKERRSESDFDHAYWEAHLSWLRGVFGAKEFTTREVQSSALSKPGEYEAPPGMDDPSGRQYTRSLGQAYSKKKDRRYGPFRLVKSGMGHRSTIKWQVTTEENGGKEGTEGTPQPPRMEKSVSIETPHDVHAHYGEPGRDRSLPSLLTSQDQEKLTMPRSGFDLETLSVEKLHTSEPGTFIKLLGFEGEVDEPAAWTQCLTRVPLVGHNNFFFDSLALDRHAGIPVEETILNSRDLRIAAFQNDPPTSYETKSGPGFKSYSLDALGARYLNRPKSELGNRLAKEFGGWDNIPADDQRYRDYCRDDVALAEELDRAIPFDPYEARESRVCAITARAAMTGFRVDVDGLTARAKELEARSEDGKTMLAEKFGFPLTNKAGKPAAAPQRTKEGKEAFAAALESFGFPVDNWPRGKDTTLSLSKETMAFALGHAEREVPAAVPVIEAVQTMNGVRNNAANVLRYTTSDGRVHPAFLPFQATGRWSVLEPGLTVLKKGVADSERAFLIPDEGDVLVSIDLDQVDIRCVAAHSQDPNLLAIVNDPARDIHSEISVMAFGSAEGKNRHYAKSLDLGWLYGRGIRGMVENTPGVTMEAATSVDTSMREQFGQVLGWQSAVRDMGEAGVLLDNGFGRRLRVDPERSYTQAPAMLGQSTTRDLIAEGLIDLAHNAPEIIPMLRVIVHDEVVLSVPREHREEIASIVQSCMTRWWAPAGLSNPVHITAGNGKPFTFGETWAELYL